MPWTDYNWLIDGRLIEYYEPWATSSLTSLAAAMPVKADSVFDDDDYEQYFVVLGWWTQPHIVISEPRRMRRGAARKSRSRADGLQRRERADLATLVAEFPFPGVKLPIRVHQHEAGVIGLIVPECAYGKVVCVCSWPRRDCCWYNWTGCQILYHRRWIYSNVAMP